MSEFGVLILWVWFGTTAGLAVGLWGAWVAHQELWAVQAELDATRGPQSTEECVILPDAHGGADWCSAHSQSAALCKLDEGKVSQ